MKRIKRVLLAALFLPMAAASAGEAGVEIGVLTCKTIAGTGYNLIIRSTVDVECKFSGTGTSGGEEAYKGETGVALGVDLNIDREATIAFTVLSAGDITPGMYALTGKYVGAKASATVGVGVGAAVLIGGGDQRVTLQPLALEGSTGLGVAAGLGYLYLEPAAR